MQSSCFDQVISHLASEHFMLKYVVKILHCNQWPFWGYTEQKQSVIETAKEWLMLRR